MATIGSITVAFTANLDEFESSVEEVSDLLDGLSESVDDISEKIDASSKTMKVKAVLDSTGVEKATKDIASKSATVAVTADAKQVTEAVEEEVKKSKKKVEETKFSLAAEAKDIFATASQAASDVKKGAGTIVLKVQAAVSGVTEAISAAKQANSAYTLATKSVGDYASQLLNVGSNAKGLQNATVFAFGLTNAIIAGNEAYASGTSASEGFFDSLSRLSSLASNQRALTAAVSQGVGAFVGTGVAAAAYRLAIEGVNSATEDLDPKLKVAVRGFAGMALVLLQTEAASRLSASATTLAASALRSQASPLAAVTAFMRSYRDGLREMGEASTAAVDRQRALVRIQNLVSQVFAAAKNTASSAILPFSTGFERARASGQSFISAVSRGLSGQAQSIDIVRNSIKSLGDAFAPFIAGFSRASSSGASFFAALDRGFLSQLQSIALFRSAVASIGSAFDVTGISGFFEPLVTGFSRAAASGAGFFAATARGVSGQLNSLAAYRAVRDAVVSAGEAVYRFGGSIIGVNASTKIGRDAFFALRASMQAVRSTAADAAAYLGVLKTSFAAMFAALPGGRSVVEALSSSFALLNQQSSSLMSSLPSVGSVVKTLAPWFTLASVATGRFAHSLEEMSVHMQSIEQMADRFGATTGEMQVLAYAAESAQVGMGQLAKATQAFMTNVSKVKVGQLNTESVQEAKFAFDRLGISIEELRNKNPNEVFGLVSEELLKVKDPADRAAIAFDLFGKQAVNVLPALKGLKEAAEDSKRLGLETSKVNFDRLLKAESSFDRVKAASKSLGVTMLAAFAPLQTGWNNLMADLIGGLSAALGPMRTMFASATVPLQVFMEVIGRIGNILLRVVGVVTTFVAAMSRVTALAPAWTAIGDVIKGALTYIEQAVNLAQQVADAFSSQMNPSIEESASTLDKLTFAAKTFAAVIVSAGVGSAIMQSFGIQAGAAFSKFAAGLLKINFASVFGGIIKLVRMLTIDIVSAATKWVASVTLMGVRTIAGFLTPFFTTVASVITGNSAMAVSATATGWAMAAAWVIGTLGIAAIIVAVIAVIQNLDNLYDYFANFGDNAAELFTLEGLTDAATAVTEAIKAAFMTLFNWVTGFFSGILQNIIMGIQGIKMPEKVNASTASVSEIVQSRTARQSATASAQMAAAGMVGADTSKIKLPTNDVTELSKALTGARSDMVSLSLNAARFGEAGRKAFLAAKADFDKLQQQLADNTLETKVIVDENGVKRSETTLEAFERRTKEIRGRLEENLDLADVISPEQLQASAEEMRKTVDDAFTKVRGIMRGQDLGSDMTTDRFFPTSDKIKAAADKFAKSYQSELIEIEKKLQSGEYGKGQNAMKIAQQEREKAQQKFDRNIGKIEADLSFAADIRKALEDAFLTPAQKFEKELKKIQDNMSLTDQEKSLATVQAQKGMVESTFGKSAGQSLREKEEMFKKASAVDQYGRTAFTSSEGNTRAGNARQASERNKLDMERRQAAGLDATASQKLKAGADNIADVFGVAGMTMSEIQAKLSPQQFAEYQEAIKKNAQAVKESLGVETSGAEKLRQSRDKLDKALADGVIDQDEYNKATKANKDALLSSLGISKTPAEDFETAVAKIRESASELTPDELARGLKEAKDKLLNSLGIPKSPAQEAQDRLNKLNEAFQKGQISTEEFAKGAAAAKNQLLQALGIPLDPVEQLRTRMNDLQEALSKGQITQEEFARGQEEAKRSMLPGGEEESPVKKFKRDMDAVDRAVKEGLISEADGGERKMRLQAQLQEDMKPALDRLAPDRRAVESSDSRSKAGVDTFFRILRGNDNPSLKAQLEIARNTKLLAEAAAEPEAAPVIANMQGR